MTGAHEETTRAPGADDRPRTPDELRADLGELRAELGDTVEELAHRVDVPARARDKRDEVVATVREQAGRARSVVAGQPLLQDRRVQAGLLAALVVVVVALRRRRT